MKMDNQKFLPFYERLIMRTPWYFTGKTGKALVSILIGGVFLVAHSLVIGQNIFDDWSWFLAALITTAMLGLYYATYTLQNLLPELDIRLRPHAGNEIYMPILRRILSDRNFVLAGFVFGLVNSCFGVFFGLCLDRRHR